MTPELEALITAVQWLLRARSDYDKRDAERDTYDDGYGWEVTMGKDIENAEAAVQTAFTAAVRKAMQEEPTDDR